MSFPPPSTCPGAGSPEAAAQVRSSTPFSTSRKFWEPSSWTCSKQKNPDEDWQRSEAAQRLPSGSMR